MRAHVRAFCAATVGAFSPRDPIVEFGALQVEGSDASADLRPLFNNSRYIGCDLRAGKGVDRVEDISHTTFDRETVGTIVCLDTLEHVFRVNDAFDEMFRILAPGALLIVAAPMRFPIHNYPEDYWRVTPRCLHRLTAPFAFRLIGWQGTETFPHTVFAVAIKAPATGQANERAARLVTDYSRWLRETRAGLPLPQKLRRAMKSLYRSKGERQELANEYTARFEIDSVA